MATIELKEDAKKIMGQQLNEDVGAPGSSGGGTGDSGGSGSGDSGDVTP